MKTLVISPSGKFYGSEQFLYDYLAETQLNTDILVPRQGVFKEKLQSLVPKHSLILFSPAKLSYTYLRIFLWLLFNRYHNVYCNEAGHSRYLCKLAGFFPKKKFFIHIRINEDAHPRRWPAKLPANVRVLIMSVFLQRQFKFDSILLYDLYRFADHPSRSLIMPHKMKIGVIGRITLTKGFGHFMDLVRYLKTTGYNNFTFLLYGDVGDDVKDNGMIEELSGYENVKLMGFCNDKNAMYNSFDCLMHFCETEPLGRIILEAIEYNIPFIGYDAGGIGEIGHLTGLEEFLVPFSKGSGKLFVEKLDMILNNYGKAVNTIIIQKKQASDVFNLKKYTSQLDAYLQ